MGGHDVMAAREELLKLGIPDYPAPDRAVYALDVMCEYSMWRSRPRGISLLWETWGLWSARRLNLPCAGANIASPLFLKTEAGVPEC